MEDDNNSQNEASGETGFYVEPKRDCPHIKTYFTITNLDEAANNAPCDGCGHKTENWVCLSCNKKFCSRYIQGHMKEHAEKAKHQICASYSDLSIWCYECDSYITDPIFVPLLKKISFAKFGDSGTGGRFTAHKTADQMEERQDKPAAMKKKIYQLAQLIKNSKHVIFFTGAGISTSAGVPDFRGPQGVWTLKARGQARTAHTVPMLSAVPTPSHMSLVKLQSEGILKYLISQNVDGLHRRSGINPSNFAELHGNSNLEVCEKCGKEYMRDFDCTAGANVHHVTRRRCSVPNCDGNLLDTIINFGESLPYHLVSRGFEESEKADLCICLGSSLTVTPAADMPKIVGKKKGGNLVIVNLQKTPLDKLADLRIFGKCDEVMQGVMEELGLEIPAFVLNRRVVIAHDAKQVRIEGVDVDGTPLTLFCGVEAIFSTSGRKVEIDLEDAPFVFNLGEGEEKGEVEITVHFMGHYNEPPLKLPAYNLATAAQGAKKYLLQFDPTSGQWQHEEIAVDGGCELVEGHGLTEAEFKEKYPARIRDKEHEHELELKPNVYNGHYRCNKCLKPGSGFVYNCEECQYDLHPACGLWRRD